MKRVLITGKGSYIGKNFISSIKLNNCDIVIDEIDVKGESWKTIDFSIYDAVYHLAGLAHSTPSEKDCELYYQVNTDLAVAVAKKAKADQVKQFIFMSSLIVYGKESFHNKARKITWDTPLKPDNFYGDSKKQAEIQITGLQDEHFKTVIIRSPMIYGRESKGNYNLLSKFAKRTLFFPTLKNKRSMIYVGNLVAFVTLLIINEDQGIFLPQNKDYVSTNVMVKEIAKISQHKIFFIGIFNPIIKIVINQKYINKLFGNLYIDKELSAYKDDYNKFTFEESIELSEGNKL